MGETTGLHGHPWPHAVRPGIGNRVFIRDGEVACGPLLGAPMLPRQRGQAREAGSPSDLL